MARDAALHGRARRRDARRDLGARASAGVYARAQRKTRARPRAGRHSGGADRSRRAGDLSRTGPARDLSAHRFEAPRFGRAAIGGGARELRRVLRGRARRAARADRARRRRVCRTARSWRASACGCAAARAITDLRSMSPQISSRSSASTCAAIRDFGVTRLEDLVPGCDMDSAARGLVPHLLRNSVFAAAPAVEADARSL